MSVKKKNETVQKQTKEKTAVKNTVEKISGKKPISLAEQIKKTAKGLYYISETDAEIVPFIGKPAGDVTGEEILAQSESAADSIIEEKDFTEFFNGLIQIQDWFGDEEKATAQKFGRLKALLESNLRNLKVFKIGKIQLDVYAVGLDAESNLAGIKTEAVET